MLSNSPLRPKATLLAASLLILSACSTPPIASPTPTAITFTQTNTPASVSVTTVTPVLATNDSIPIHPAQAACSPAEEGEVDTTSILEMGPGPGIPATTASGEMLLIVGTVYTTDCTPLSGAVLNVWQTDANGEYGPAHGSSELRCCYLMGSLNTDADGRFQLVTMKPAHYKGEQPPPPAHIHVEISHPQVGQLQTEIVFADDPYLPASLQGYVVVALETIPASAEAASYLRGIANIILD